MSKYRTEMSNSIFTIVCKKVIPVVLFYDLIARTAEVVVILSKIHSTYVIQHFPTFCNQMKICL